MPDRPTALPSTWPAAASPPWRGLLALLAGLALAACSGAQPRLADRMAAGDLALVAETTQRALEDGRVGLSSNWSNTATGVLGTVTPTRTFTTAGGTPCRDYQQTATIEGRTIFAFDTACRGAGGQWKSTHFGSLAQPIREGETSLAQARPGAYYDDPFCRWPYRDPFCHPRYGGFGPSLGLGVGSRSGVGFGF